MKLKEKPTNDPKLKMTDVIMQRDVVGGVDGVCLMFVGRGWWG